MTTPRPGYGDTVDAVLTSVLPHLSMDDTKRLALALLDQLDVKPAAVASVAVLLGVIYRDGSPICCWACARLATIERNDQPPGFGAFACDRCDEAEREAWAKARALSRYEDACDALADEQRDDRMEQRIPRVGSVAS